MTVLLGSPLPALLKAIMGKIRISQTIIIIQHPYHYVKDIIPLDIIPLERETGCTSF